jgi:hypothetical protein
MSLYCVSQHSVAPRLRTSDKDISLLCVLALQILLCEMRFRNGRIHGHGQMDRLVSRIQWTLVSSLSLLCILGDWFWWRMDTSGPSIVGLEWSGTSVKSATASNLT